jgi:hypothetical protein
MFAWPLLWIVYTFAHGAATGWYPYPFLDAHTHGYGRIPAMISARTTTAAVLRKAIPASLGPKGAQ